MFNFCLPPHGSPSLLLPQEPGMVGCPAPGTIEMGHLSLQTLQHLSAGFSAAFSFLNQHFSVLNADSS